MKPTRNPFLRNAILAGAISVIAAAPAAFAANTTYTWTGGNSTWNTSANWNSGVGPVASGIGDIVKLSSNSAIDLNTNITIGVICYANGSANQAPTITSSGGSILTMDGTGVTIIRATNTAGAQVAGEAYLGAYQNNSTVGLKVNSDVNMASNLGIGGSLNNNYVTVGGVTANTYKIRNSTSTAKTLNLRAQSSGAITINSSIGADQTQGTGGIDIVYLSSASGAATINGNIGGATGTGQAITLTNSAGNTGNLNITGALGQSISSITQNSATSTMEITHNAGNTNYAGGFSIKQGTLSLKGPGGNTAVNFGSGTVLLGDTTGSAAATLAISNSNTFANDITVQAGSAGTKSLQSLTSGGAPILSGNLTLNDSLTVGGNGIDVNYTFSGVANTIANGKTLNLTQGSSTTTSTYTLSGKFSGLGAIATSGTTTQTAVIKFSSTTSDYSGGTTLGANGALAVIEVAADTTAGVGSFGSGTILLNGATLRADTGADRSLSNAVTIGADTIFATQASEKSLTFAGAAQLTGNRTLTVDTGSTVAGKSVTFSNGIGQDTAGRTLTKAGAGVLNLNGANSYSGLTTVNAGALNIGSGGSLNSGNALTIGASGKADFANAGQTLGAVNNANTTANALNFSASTGTVTLASLSGAGNTRFGSNGTVTGGISTGTVNAVGLLTSSISGGTVAAGSLSATAVSGGATTVSGVATIGTMSSGTANLNGATSAITTLNGGTVNLGSSTVLTVDNGTTSGSITGASGSLTKSSGGILTLSSGGTYSYGGATSVTAGTLLVNGNISTSSLTTVSGTGTLGGSGTVGAASVLTGGTFAPGNSIDSLDIAGALTLGAGSFSVFEINTAGDISDLAIVSGLLTFGGTLNVNNVGATLVNGDTFDLFNWGSKSGIFSAVNLPGLDPGLTWDDTALYTNGTLTVVPEPRAALLGGIGMLMLLRRRRA